MRYKLIIYTYKKNGSIHEFGVFRLLNIAHGIALAEFTMKHKLADIIELVESPPMTILASWKRPEIAQHSNDPRPYRRTA